MKSLKAKNLLVISGQFSVIVNKMIKENVLTITISQSKEYVLKKIASSAWILKSKEISNPRKIGPLLKEKLEI